MIPKILPNVGKGLIGLALCVSSVPAIANPACALSLQGCVLPVQETVAPVQTTTPGPVIVDEAAPKSLGILPILAGLAALGALAWLILDDDDDDEPESP